MKELIKETIRKVLLESSEHYLSFNELENGKKYKVYNTQFGAENTFIFTSGNAVDSEFQKLGVEDRIQREIGYGSWSNRNFQPARAKDIARYYVNNEGVSDFFSIWRHNVDGDTATMKISNI